MGASAYFTSPLWALLIGASLVQAGIASPHDGGIGASLGAISGWLLLLTSVLLLGPKLLSVAWMLLSRTRRTEFAGGPKTYAGVLVASPPARSGRPRVGKNGVKTWR